MTGKAKRKERQERGDTTPYHEIDNTQGSVLWAFNRFRSKILTTLLDDLGRHENEGISDEECDYIKQALSSMVNAATELPDGGFLKSSVFHELQDFEQIYHDWNKFKNKEQTDAPKHRKIAYQKLRKKRHSLSRTIRNNQFTIQNELDLGVIENMYSAVDNLVNAIPKTLENLSQAFVNISKNLPGKGL